MPAAPAASAAPHASVPCWKRLLNDWYDGTINNIYPLHCYQEAINHLPVDVRVYSSARDDILAAEQAAANHQHAPREKSPPPSSTKPAATGSSTTTSASAGTTTSASTGTTTSASAGTTTSASAGTTTSASTTPATTSTSSVTPTQTTTTPTTDTSSPKKKHGIAGLLADITPGDPQSFPLPLLVLGALAILLVIAGGAGMVWQRAHPRDRD